MGRSIPPGSWSMACNRRSNHRAGPAARRHYRWASSRWRAGRGRDLAVWSHPSGTSTASATWVPHPGHPTDPAVATLAGRLHSSLFLCLHNEVAKVSRALLLPRAWSALMNMRGSSPGPPFSIEANLCASISLSSLHRLGRESVPGDTPACTLKRSERNMSGPPPQDEPR